MSVTLHVITIKCQTRKFNDFSNLLYTRELKKSVSDSKIHHGHLHIQHLNVLR